MASEAEKAAQKPDAAQRASDARQIRDAAIYSERAARRCWTPQEARAFARWDD